MTDERDLRIPDFFGKNFCFPQFDYTAGSMGFGGYYMPDFNSYAVNTYQTNFTPFFNFFDFSLNSINIPTLNMGTSVFNFPLFTPIFNNIYLQSPQQIIPTPAQTAEKPAAEVSKPEKTEQAYEPEESDAAKVIRNSPAPTVKTEEKPKTQKALASLDSNIYTAEEILPGRFVHKGKYLNTKDLKPYMKENLVKLSEKAAELGYTLVVSDGFRSHQTQINLKREKPRLAATPGRSPHEYGVAVDVGLYKNGRFIDIYKEAPEFGEYAESLGLEWGARWRTKYEPWHFNMRNWTELADVRSEYDQWNNLA